MPDKNNVVNNPGLGSLIPVHRIRRPP